MRQAAIESQLDLLLAPFEDTRSPLYMSMWPVSASQ